MYLSEELRRGNVAARVIQKFICRDGKSYTFSNGEPLAPISSKPYDIMLPGHYVTLRVLLNVTVFLDVASGDKVDERRKDVNKTY